MGSIELDVDRALIRHYFATCNFDGKRAPIRLYRETGATLTEQSVPMGVIHRNLQAGVGIERHATAIGQRI